MPRLPQLVLLFSICLQLSFTVNAQSATATLSGTVTDQNGDVVPGVNISVINLAQGFQRSTTTNDEGAFVVPLLPPGTYITKAEREGFTTAEVRDLVLNVNDQVSLKIQLKVGNLKGETLDVTYTPSLIDQSPAVGTVVDRQFVENIPLNGRSFQSLLNLTNGVVLTKTGVTAQGQFSVNGQRANANYFMVDGVSANIGASASTAPGQSGAGSLPALTASGGTNNLVSVDALQEFKLQTSTYAAEFGRTPGAQISIVTRSGTDSFHGSVFDYFRNDVFDANDWFANANRQPKPPLRQNDFGGVFGGPLYLPRFGEGGSPFYSGKHRTFFFFSYEGLRLRQPLVGLSDVPSVAAREAASPSIQPFINLYPKPNGPNKANGLASFSSSFSNPTSLDATSVRVDATASPKLTLFGRYNHAPSQTVGRGGLIQTLNTLTFFKGKTQTLTLGSTLFLNPDKIINDLRVNYSRTTASSFFRLDDFGGAVVPAGSVIFSSSRSSETSQFSLALTGVPNGTIFLGRAPESVQRQFNVVNSVSVLANNHQLKFGVDYRRLSPIFNAPQYSQGLVFSGVGNPSSPAPGTLLSGRLNFASVSSQISPQVAIFNNLSLYAQDTWTATTRMTLTYGLRWECVPPPHGIDSSNPIAVTQVTDLPNMSIAPPGTPLWNTTYDNFAPRVGISYQLTNQPGREMIVRGGFGLFYDLGDGQASNAFAFAYPFTASKTLIGTPFPLSAPDATAPVVGPAPTTSDFLTVFDPNLELPLVYQWNVSAEKSLGAQQSITASYVAAVGRRLLRMVTLRSPSPTVAGNVSITRNDATSDYHALQVQFQRRLTRGFQALASYTWAHSIDIASGDQLAGTPAVLSDPQRDRGPSDFDVRHAFNAALTYNIPSALGEVMGKILSDWAIDSIFTARSATPVNVTYAANAPFGSIALRPDLVPGIPLYLVDPNVPRGRRFNNTRVTVPGNPNPQIGPFLRPTTVRQGTLGRNALRGFSVWQLDMGVRRQFALSEQVKVQFKTEFFNIFNHPNFGDPVGTLTSSTFGVSTVMLGRSLGTGGLTGGFNPLYQVGGPRSMQFSLKLEF